MRHFGVIILAAGVALVGCGGPTQYRPVETNQRATGEHQAIARPVEDVHASEIRRALAGLVADYEATDPPKRGPARGRWIDVPRAAAWAVADAELAIVSQTRVSGSWEFALMTLDERPGRLVVRPAPASEIWNASATIGLFPDREENAKHSRRLLEAFTGRMAAFAGQLRFDSQD